ncbi:MAG: hypothetical protein Q7S98_05155, partial [Deltaproteobacteria bacterium]|nr:hypothetical protein [Deltaproteobacteria bacterium]
MAETDAVMITGRMVRAINAYARSNHNPLAGDEVVIPDEFVGGTFYRGNMGDVTLGMVRYFRVPGQDGKPSGYYKVQALNGVGGDVRQVQCPVGLQRGSSTLFSDLFR